MGIFFTRCSDLNEILHQSSYKPTNDQGEFELDRARSKNNIAKNLFALEHEMHNTLNFSGGSRRRFHGSGERRR